MYVAYTDASLGLLEDVIDVCSGTDASAVFAYIESKVALLKQVWGCCYMCSCVMLFPNARSGIQG